MSTRILLLIFALIPAFNTKATVLYSHDYNIMGLGSVDQVEFSTDISMGAIIGISSVEIELTHSYVGELVLTLKSPTGQDFLLLDHDGLRTRVGAGNGLLNGVELYTLRDPAEAVFGVVDWDFTRYQPGGNYGAREWPSGSWEAGTWNLSLFSDDVSAFEDGVVGTVRISGLTVPEPSALFLAAAGAVLIGVRRTRNHGE
jgi:Proprotein convertase P-domain